LGVTLFVLAKGTLPVRGEPVDAALGGTPLRRAPDLVRLVGQLLEVDPRSRPRHAEWVAGELDRIRAASGFLHAAAAAAWSPPAGAREPRTADLSGQGSATVELVAPTPDPRPRFVGRDAEMAALAAAAARAASGEVTAALISGPLGVG